MNLKAFASVAGLVLAISPIGTQAQADHRPPITGISHIAVYTSDSAKADEFYVHDLGGVKRSDPENPSGVRYYFSPIQFVEVLPLPAVHTINRLDHVAFVTANANGLRLYMTADGITTPDNVESGSDGSKWFAVADPEGNKVEFVQPPAHPEAINSPNPISNHIIHVGYMVHDRAAEDSFYQKVLGFRPYWYGGFSDTVVSWVSQQVPDGTDWIEYMMVYTPEKTGLPPSVTAASLGSMDHFSLGVPDIKKLAETLYFGDRLPQKNSGPKLGRDGKWQYNLFDPDGTRAENMEFQPVGEPCCSKFTASSPTK